MPLADYPLAPPRPRPRHLPDPDPPNFLAIGIGIGFAFTCVVSGLLFDTRRKPKPKPQPCHRVTVIDKDSGNTLIRDVPYILEERWDNHQYFFKFQGGGERFLDLRDTNYIIVRREA